MRGHRLEGEHFHPTMPRGSYGKNERGEWEICTPNGRRGLASEGHVVTEHEDGTISVVPSLLIDPLDLGTLKRPGWHGWLERGEFREI